SGSIADQIGFRRSLFLACLLLVGGYFLMGYPVWFGGHALSLTVSDTVTAGPGVVVPVALAILLVGIGGSFVKPCIAGTVQRTHLGKATLAFGIFYMVVNIGSVTGRLVAFGIRTRLGRLDPIFAVSMAASVVAFLVVLLLYRDPESGGEPTKPRRSLPEILLGMFQVLGNGRFALFLVVSSGFYFIYNQVYNVLPLYVKKTVELSPAMDLYTLANPVTIVLFQLLVTNLFGKLPPIKSIVVGTVIIGLAMLINVAPLFMAGGVTARVWLPLGSLFIIMTVALIAFGELFAASRLYEYIGSLAPKGQEGLFLGYSNLPMAIGSLVGGPAGAWIFNRIMCRGAVLQPSGLLKLDPRAAASGWILLAVFGLGSALSLWLYNRWLQRQEA
ncbi:MAG TPA: MFS transporter, partial [Holophagaceae bacterium]